MSLVKLIGTPGSLFCSRIEWALKIKGLSYEYIEEDLTNKSSLLLKLNPVHKKIPVLVHNDNPLAESLVILEYIDETWKHCPILPEDPYQRAQARFWAKFVDEKCIFGVWFAMRAEGEEKQKAVESAQELLALLEKQIEGKSFFSGEKIGYLDLVVGWMALWVSAMEEVGEMEVLDAAKFPWLSKWTEMFVQDAVIQEVSPPREVVVKYFRDGLKYLNSLAAAASKP